MAYQLVSELYAHAGPVRSLGIGPSGEVVSGCQADSPNIRRWQLRLSAESQAPELAEVGTSIQHDHWVTAVTSLGPGVNDMYPEGCIVTGCKDSKIRIFSKDGEPMMMLEGHTNGVISFSWSSTGKLISGSWDGTARVWDLAAGGVCVCTLPGHENGVSVLGLENGQIITTSTGESVNDRPANFQIRFWDEATGKQIGTSLKDHDGSIRSICSIPGICAFATSSNDGSVRVRSVEDNGQNTLGVCYHPLSEDGMMPFILHVAALHSDSGMCDFVSCGEDGSVMVWNGAFEAAQRLQHPTSAWCALAIPNTDGDFITAGHDGMIRYFSKNPVYTGGMNSLQLHSVFESQAVEAAAKRKAGPSSEELAKCPLWDNRGSRPGRSEGDVCVFNKAGVMIAAQWADSSKVWIEVGEVTGSGDAGTIGGVTYDHVMPVEMDSPTGGTMQLQLGYNNGENPFVAASRFIDANNLGPQYTAQIADWIQARAGKNTPTIGSSSGGHASSSSSSSSSSPSSSGAVVPPPSPSSFSFAPQAWTVFDDIPAPAAMDKMVTKINEFNAVLAEAASPNALSPADLETLDSLLKRLAATSQYHVSVITAAHVLVLAKMSRWNSACAFPAFDILRMTCLHPSGAAVLAAHSGPIVARAVELLSTVASTTSSATGLTALRFLGNAFRHDAMRDALLAGTDNLAAFLVSLQAALAFGGSINKLQRAAMANLALNMSLHFANAIKRQDEAISNGLVQSSAIAAIISLLTTLLSGETEAPDVIFRSLKALGSILATWARAGGRMLPATSEGVAAALNAVRAGWGSRLDPVCLRCLDEVAALSSA